MIDDPILSTLSGTIRMLADLAARPDEFLAALRRLGYQVDSGVAIDAVPASEEIQALVPLIAEHIESLSDDFTFEELLAALELIGPVGDVVDALEDADVEIPGADLDWGEIGGDVALRLPQMVAFDLIEHRAAWLVALLEAIGLANRSVYELPVTADGPDEEHTSLALDTSGLGDLIADPGDFATTRFLSEGSIDSGRIGRLIALVLADIAHVTQEPPDLDYVQTYLCGWLGDEDLRVTRVRLDHRAPQELRGISIVIGPWRSGGGMGPADGLAVGVDVGDLSPDPAPLALGEVSIDVPQPVVGITVRPNGQLALVADTVGELGVALTLSGPEPWRLLGAASGPRLDLGGVTVDVSFDPSEPDVALTLGLQTLALRLDSEGADSFMAALIAGIEAELDMEVTLSRDGLRFGADAGLTFRLPVTITVGPIVVSGIAVAAGVDDDGALVLSVVVDAEATVGPLQVAVSDVGVRALIRSGDAPDDFTLDIGIDLPDRVAFAFEGSEVISGGGFLEIDHDAGRYAGGAALTVIEVGVSLLVVIDTQLPGGDEGWAFFGSLGIDIPGIPLGFGFTLEGVGGIIALNRRMDTEALALGLKQGAADAIMFPDDPVRDALILIPQIDAYFPIDVGNTVIGPVVAIGWGAPVSLVTAQIGVMISMPQGLIVILGSIAMALPDPEVPIVEITMDSMGVVDLANGTVTVAASLYDSRLLGVIELSGDMAFHVATSPQPYFALSIGGWHPSFQPPSILPSVFSELERMRACIALTEDIGITLSAYLALTPNTVQFGGRFEIEASVKVVLTTYTARGWFGFDVLLIFSPFKLVADVTAGVAVYSGNKELMGVSLGAHVEGPKPWFASGRAQFTFFGVKVKFDFTVGDKAGPVALETVDLLPLIQAQIDADNAWEVTRGSGLQAGVVLTAHDDPAASAPMLADGYLTMRQTVAPLEQTLEVYGHALPAQSRIDFGETQLTDATTGTALSGVTADPVLDWFAPAQFEKMSDSAKLAAPSYELHHAGVRFGAETTMAGADESTAMPLGHETLVWETPPTPDEPPVVSSAGRGKSRVLVDGWYDHSAITARRVGRPTVQVPHVTVAAATMPTEAAIR